MTVDWPDLVGDGVVFLGISVILAALGVGCFGARTYTSWHCTKRFLLDYWLSLLTFTLCVFSQVFFVISVTFGLGFHVQDLGHADIVMALHTSWVSQLTAIVAAVTGKLSIIAFLDQIRGRHQGRPWFLYFIGISNVIVNIIVVVFILLQCTPLERLWDERVPGDCKLRRLNNHYAYFQGGYSALSDAALALYPIRLVSRLQVSTRMKVGLSVLLGFGLLAAAMAVIKTVQLTNLAHHDEGADITFYVARLAVATLVEAWIVMAVGCIPTLRPLTRAVVKRFRGSSVARQRTLFFELENYAMQSVRKESAAQSNVQDRKNSMGMRQKTCCDAAAIELYGIDGRGFADSKKGLARGIGDTMVMTRDMNTGEDMAKICKAERQSREAVTVQMMG